MPWRLRTAELVPYFNSMFTQGCLNAAVVAFLIYDYVLTLGREVELFWCGRGAVVAKAVFLILRISVLGNAITTILTTYVTKYDLTLFYHERLVGGTLAGRYIRYSRSAFFFFSLGIKGTHLAPSPEAVTALRAYAVSGGQWIWTIVTSVLAFANFALTAVGFTCTPLPLANNLPYFPQVHSSKAFVPFSRTAIILDLLGNGRCFPDAKHNVVTLAILISTALADAIVIIATWVRRGLWRHSISWLLFRDGTIYFLLQLVLISRLLINLREAPEGDIYIGSQDPPVGSDGFPEYAAEASTLRFEHAVTVHDEEASAQVEEHTGADARDNWVDAAQLDVHEELRDNAE
ncbi:uncharacterized protein B0H18DRAFT_1108289 [Fomitopsis serialis]|uniref:uncharacterized protein n=1 Tax=Fomitopsis serialis TaxID=139415 RepID=UPI0020088755|nr:uncharacterized protein B0H18DRAFT_1108289 [Neoantrodia serialis]KAH9914608.1 hypothetical protein B0H18DRAFT_1108289 [Neoantrodia serialis]